MNDLDRIIGKYVGGIIDIRAIAMQVYTILKQHINSADLPSGIARRIEAAVKAPQVISPTHAVITIGEVEAQSVYSKKSFNGPDGWKSKYGAVDLVMIFNQRKGVRQTYYPVGIRENGKVAWAPMTSGWTRSYNNHFLEKTVADANALLAQYGGYAVLS